MKQVSFVRGRELKTGHETGLDAKIGTEGPDKSLVTAVSKAFFTPSGFVLF